MTSLILVINSGSSSLKYQVIDSVNGEVTAKGMVDRIGETDTNGVQDHEVALSRVLRQLSDSGIHLNDLAAAGHRVVHGGPIFTTAVLVDSDVEKVIESLNELAPLHNPANLMAIAALRKLAPTLPQVAVFDTAFHSTIPAVASTYALPAAIAQKHAIRRYGFHGTSGSYVTKRAAQMLEVPLGKINLIVCHIGNGASITAVRHGESIDTSMGMTPIAGLVMGTRAGDIDPGAILHLLRSGDVSIDQLDEMLNRESGLKGMTGLADLRELRTQALGGNESAVSALEVYSYQARKYVSAFAGLIPDLHAIVFTAGVGENDANFRTEVLRPLHHLGFGIDSALNADQKSNDRFIDTGGTIRSLVIATNEEREIAEEVVALLHI